MADRGIVSELGVNAGLNRTPTGSLAMDPLFTVRLANATDVGQIEAIVSSAYEKYFARIGRKPKPMLANHHKAVTTRGLWVCDGEKGLTAVLELIPMDTYLLIENIAVRPECQGCGSGTKLIAFAESEALRQGFSEVRLYTNEMFTENIALYSRLGYRQTHRESFGNTAVVHMAKSV